MARIRVGLVDDHEMVHIALQGILKNEKEISLDAKADNGRAGLQMLRSASLDVVLLDLGLPDVSGLQVADRMRKFYPNVGVVMLTSAQHLFYVEHLLKLGVRGYVTKNSEPQDLITAIKKVANDELWFSQDVIFQLSLAQIRQYSPKEFMELTTLEKEIMLKMVRGEDSQEISKSLCISKKTVYDYSERLLRKLNVKNRVGLALLTMRLGIIDVDRMR